MLKFLPKNFLARRKFFLFKKSLSSEITPFLIVIFSLFFAGIVTVVISPRNSPTLQQEKNATAPNLLGEQDKEIQGSATKDEKKNKFETTQQRIGGDKKTDNSTNDVLGATSGNQNQEVQTPPPPAVSAPNLETTPLTSVPQTSPTVSVAIIPPDATSNFAVVLEEAFNVCDVLVKAKNEEKISSLTLDDSYLSTYKSLYVYEINGFANNWTFTVNGGSPLGCSLYFPKDKDTIVWKFG